MNTNDDSNMTHAVEIRFTLNDLYDNREFEHLTEFLQDKAQEQVNMMFPDSPSPEISIVDFEIVGTEGGHTLLVKVSYEI